MAAVKKNKKNPKDGPKAWEFVLVRDEKGEFKYYYQNKFYSYDEVARLIGPEEAKKLKQKKEIEKKKVEKKIEEIKEMPMEKRELEQKMLKDMAQKVLYELNLTLKPEQKEKLIKVIISRFRSVRKDVELKYILTASVSAGGLGFDEKKAETIIQTVKKYLAEVEKKRIKIIRGEQIAIEETKPGPIPVTQPVPKAVPPVRKKLVGLDEKKPVVSDVTSGAGLVGPVDELRTMDLVNLRRLGTNREEIVSEILERVNLLGEQSLQSKVDGIKAWQQSPVYQMYLNLGYQSIRENRPVEQIINEKLSKKEKVMNFEEFGAITELNSKIQF